MNIIKGANMDIDFTTVPNVDWEVGTCPRGDKYKCATKNTSICPYFGGIEAPDKVLCSYKE